MDKVQHFEIPAKDLKQAQQFYGKIFGWNMIDVGDDNMQYIMVHTGKTDKKGMLQEKGVINGGLMPRVDAKQPIVIVTVSSVDKTLEKIKKQGGKTVLKKQEVMGMGYYARFADKDGNILGLWEHIKQ
jgi:hypothetical protein